MANANPLAAFVFRAAAGTVQQEIVKKDVDCIIANVHRDGMREREGRRVCAAVLIVVAQH